MALAAMDTGGMIDDLWGTFLPLAGRCETLVGPAGSGAAAAGSGTQPDAGAVPGADDAAEQGNAIDIFAY
jgi:hypothetical protein